MYQLDRVCKNFTLALAAMSQSTTRRDYGVLGWLSRSANRQIQLTGTRNSKTGGSKYFLEYERVDCAIDSGEYPSICETGTGTAPDNYRVSRALNDAKALRSAPLELNADFFFDTCRIPESQIATEATAYRSNLADLAMDLDKRAQDLLLRLDKELLSFFVANAGAWVNGDTSAQNLTLFTECPTDCLNVKPNPFMGLNRQLALEKAKISALNTAFLGGSGITTVQHLANAINGGATGDLSYRNVIDSLPASLVYDPYFDEVAGAGVTEKQMLEVNPNLVIFRMFSRVLSPSIPEISNQPIGLNAFLERITAQLFAGVSSDTEFYLPVLVSYRTGQGAADFSTAVLDLHAKVTGCGLDKKVSLQFIANYFLDLLPATDFYCDVSPLYTGITKHQTVAPCEPGPIQPCDTTFVPPAALCATFTLPDCGLKIPKGATVTATTISPILSIGTTYPISQTITDGVGLANLLNNLYQGSGAGVFQFDAPTGLVKYYAGTNPITGTIDIAVTGCDNLTVTVGACPSPLNALLSAKLLFSVSGGATVGQVVADGYSSNGTLVLQSVTWDYTSSGVVSSTSITDDTVTVSDSSIISVGYTAVVTDGVYTATVECAALIAAGGIYAQAAPTVSLVGGAVNIISGTEVGGGLTTGGFNWINENGGSSVSVPSTYSSTITTGQEFRYGQDIYSGATEIYVGFKHARQYYVYF